MFFYHFVKHHAPHAPINGLFHRFDVKTPLFLQMNLSLSHTLSFREVNSAKCIIHRYLSVAKAFEHNELSGRHVQYTDHQREYHISNGWN